MVSQVQVLNKVLSTEDYSLISNNGLNADYFFNYKTEFNFIKNHYEQFHKVPDLTTFQSTFPEFPIAEVTEPDSYLLDTLFDDYNAGYLAMRFNTIKKYLENGQSKEAVRYFKESVENLHNGATSTCIDLISDHSRYNSFIERSTGGFNKYLSTGLPELDKAIGGGIDPTEENMVIAARTGIGKCLEKGTLVLMADGTTKKVEDVKVGDKVQSLNRINTVLALHNGISNGYKIIPTKGKPFVVSSQHILTLSKYEQKWDSIKKKMVFTGKTTLEDIVIEDYLKLSKHQKHLRKLIRPAIEYTTKVQSIPAYILGIWLGDGTSKYGQICTADKEIVEALQNYAKANNYNLQVLASQGNSGKAKIYSITGGFQTQLRQLNVLQNKHIPLEYLTGDKQQRLELLAGLLDTDGCYIASSNSFDFTNKNKSLYDQVAQLARGLGFKVCEPKPKKIQDTLYYRLNISGDLAIIPTRITRKQATVSLKSTSTNVGFRVEPVPQIEYYGFMCDGDSRYLLADNTLTHNTWLLCILAAALSKQLKTVGIYSGEMSSDKIGYRIDTLLGKISNNSITRGDPDPRAQLAYKNYLDNLSTNNYGPIKVITPKDINGPATVDALQSFVEREHIDVLLIDQYSLLEDTSRSTIMHERVANISKAIKNLQVLKRMPIISVSQMNRTKNEDGEQDTTQIGLSDRIGQDATIILMLDRVVNKETGESQLVINPVKLRDGGDNRKLTYQADFNAGIFNYIEVVSDTEKAKALKDSYNG